jgi:SP family arabinose:H+ symporter-like MFS transporter
VALNSNLIKGTAVGALGGLLFGFDTAVIAGTTQSLTTVFHLSAAQLGITVSSALWGTVLGAIFAGVPGQRLGGRDALRIMAVLYLISALGCAFAVNWPALVFFRFVGGLGIGGSSVLGPVYIAELSPPRFRGRLVGTFQVNIVVGILLAYLSNALMAMGNFGASLWRWELGIAALPAALFLVMLFTIPQSSRWLVTQGRIREAAEVLRLLGTPNAKQELESIVASLNEQQTERTEPLFVPRYRLPIFLAVTIAMFNQLTGINAILYYLNDIFRAAGFAQLSSNVQAVAIGAMNLVATLIGMSLIDRVGRRSLLLCGSVGMAACLACVAFILKRQTHEQALVYLLAIYIFFFAISQGSVIWVYISEVFPNRVRAKGQSLGCSVHWIMNAIISAVFPIMAQRSGAYPFMFFAAMMVVQLFVVLWFYPETKGASLEELQAQLHTT